MEFSKILLFSIQSFSKTFRVGGSNQISVVKINNSIITETKYYVIM